MDAKNSSTNNIPSLPRPFPQKIIHTGSDVVLEPLSIAHVDDLWHASQDADASFNYLRYGPFQNKPALSRQVEELAKRDRQPFWAVRNISTGTVTGWLSLCDIYENDGAIEIGSIWFSPIMQRSRCSTEAVYLLMRYAMDSLRYRRLVWRCCANNLASSRAALRYGFSPEGIWRSAIVVKGQTMDIAWFSLLRHEWPERKLAIEQWLRKENFSAEGVALSALTAKQPAHIPANLPNVISRTASTR